MKHITFIAAALMAGVVFAQAPATKPAAEAPKPAAAAVPVASPAPVQAAEAPKPAPARKSRRNEDARKCLEEPDNNAIIKCAEAYL